jgi:hypothetical protein
LEQDHHAAEVLAVKGARGPDVAQLALQIKVLNFALGLRALSFALFDVQLATGVWMDGFDGVLLRGVLCLAVESSSFVAFHVDLKLVRYYSVNFRLGEV